MDDEAPGVPEWVVTYGDMMSLLLTFFIMLVSMSEVVADQKYRAVLDAIQKYVGYSAGPKAPAGKHFPLNALVARLSTLGSFTRNNGGRGGVKHESPPGKNVQVFHMAQGTGLLVGKPIPFAPTTVSLSPASEKRLQRLAEKFAGIPNKIEIIGHVDTRPLPPDAPVQDKLLLSYLRARTVFTYLVEHGVIVDRIRLRAAGDYEPLPVSGDRRSRQHDRVEIRLIDKFADHYQGRRETVSD